MTAVPSRMEAALREILQGSDNVMTIDVTREIRERGLLNTDEDKEELKSTLGRIATLKKNSPDSRETTVHLRPDPLVNRTNAASPRRPLQLPPRRLHLPQAPRHPEIVRLAGDLQLSDAVKDTACNLWHAATEIRRPRSIPPQAAFLTCLYIACRLEDCPRTISEILHYTRGSAPNITDQQIFRCYKLMKTHEGAIAGLRSEMKPYTAECFTDRWCAELGLAAIPGFSDSVRELLTNLHTQSLRREVYIPGGKVESVGSAAILMCLNNWPQLELLPRGFSTQILRLQRVSSHCHVSKQTTMKHYRDYMLPHANRILPECCK